MSSFFLPHTICEEIDSCRDLSLLDAKAKSLIKYHAIIVIKRFHLALANVLMISMYNSYKCNIAICNCDTNT